MIRVAVEFNYSEVNYSSSCCGYPPSKTPPYPPVSLLPSPPHPPTISVSSEDRSFSSTLPVSPINNRQEVNQAAQAGEHGGRQVDLVRTGVLVLLQGAERVATRLVDHDTYGRQVEHGGGHVMRQVGGQPALPSQERDEVLLVQEGEEEKIEGEEPEEDCDEQDEVAGSFVFVGGDGDPQPGTEHNLQDPDDSQKTLEELQDILPHLRLGRLGWHLSPPPVTLGPFFPDRAGAFCQLQTAGGKDGQKKVEITGVGGRVCGPTMKPKVDKLRFFKKGTLCSFHSPGVLK